MGIVLLVLCACNDSGSSHPGDGAIDSPHGSIDAPAVDAAMADVPGGVGEPAELAGTTLAHNQVRAMVDTTGIAAGPLPPMQWDPNLASLASAWVSQCQSSNGQLIDHSSTASRTNVAGYAYVGENIYASGGTATGPDAVALWASEKQYYTYATNSCASGQICGHYTQVVWRDSIHVGCAIQTCSNVAYPNTVVCNYGPGGNYGNQQPY